MHSPDCHKYSSPLLSNAALGVIAVLVFTLGAVAQSQQPNSQPASNSPSARSTAPSAAAPKIPPEVHATTEDELKPQLLGKTFYLRGLYSDDDLHFDTQGNLSASSPKSSFTLAVIQIDKIGLSKHKLEVHGLRYGLRIREQGPTGDPLVTWDKIRITPKKKSVKITIDRAQAVKPKRKSRSRKSERNEAAEAAAAEAAMSSAPDGPVTQARANEMFKEAIGRVFSQRMDERMIAELPDYWKPYFQTGKADDRSRDPSILRQTAVDRKAVLLTRFVPPSSDLAQAAGVSGVAMYHVVVSPDGKPEEIAVGHPIGFGLDENAVDSIRKASFQPALKGGKPVQVAVDLMVEFRIFSKRTDVAASPDTTAAIADPHGTTSLPGPYSANPPPKQPQ
jgi:TonB family protein